MAAEITVPVIYSSCLEDIQQQEFQANWTAHVLCLQGEGRLIYKGKEWVLRRNDCAVISHTELITEVGESPDLQVEMVVVPMYFLRNQLPANNYSIRGCIKLYDSPVMPLEEADALHLSEDFRHIRERIGEQHPFYLEMMGSLLRTMMYDLFAFQYKLLGESESTEGASFVVKSLMRLLEAGECRRHREIAYYAKQLHVSSKYLSDSVKRVTGNSATALIDSYSVPILIEYLKDGAWSLNQICDEMNFNSISYFSRYCTKHLGVSPRTFRRTANRHKTAQRPDRQGEVE